MHKQIFDLLKTFKIVAQYGNVSKAAKREMDWFTFLAESLRFSKQS